MQLRRFLLLAACTCALPAFSQTNFQYQQYPTPNDAGVSLGAQDAHAADFNGDGLADVLAPSSYSCSGGKCTVVPTLYLYLNNGTGLGAPVELPVQIIGGSYEAMERQVAISDFNSDGKLDIAALNSADRSPCCTAMGMGRFRRR